MFLHDFLNFIVTIIIIVLGFYILFAGRLAIWATLGIIALAAAANLMAVLVAGGDAGRDLVEMQAWGLVGIAVLIGVLGIILGKFKPEWAVLSIGFIAGANAALWFYDITVHFVTNIARQSDRSAYLTGLIIIIVGGLLGLWLIRAVRDEALILITVFVGTELILDGFGFSSTSSWTAIIMITLALAGVLVQYAIYLREIKSNALMPEPHPSSIAYFQDLELDL
jgi:hypothetical protein